MTIFFAVTLNYVMFVTILLHQLTVNADDYFVTITTSDVHEVAGTLDAVTISLEGSLSTTSQTLLKGPFGKGSTERRVFTAVNVGFICGVSIMINGVDNWIPRNLFVSNANFGYGRFFVLDREIRGPATTIREAVNASYGEYGPWKACDMECGNKGTRIRKRVCDQSRMGCGGITCQGSNIEIDTCAAPCIESTPTPNKTPLVDYYVTLTTSARHIYSGTTDPVNIMIEGTLSNTSQTLIGGTLETGSTDYRNFQDVNVGFICGVTLSQTGQYGWLIRNLFVSNVNRVYGRLFVFNRNFDGTPTNPTDSVTLRNSVNGSYGEWGSWSACKGECDQKGTSVRKRVCDESTSGCGGTTCQGPKMQIDLCALSPCIKSTKPITTTLRVGLQTVSTDLSTADSTIDANSKSLSGYAIALIVVSIVAAALALTLIAIGLLVRKKLKGKTDNLQLGGNVNNQNCVVAHNDVDHGYENTGGGEDVYLELTNNDGTRKEETLYNELGEESHTADGSSNRLDIVNPAQQYENVTNPSTPTTAENVIPI